MSLKENLLLQKLNRLKNAYNAKELPVEFSFGATDIWILLFIGCVSLFMTKLLWFVPLFIMCRTNKKIIVKKCKNQQSELADAVTYIELNQLQSLAEAIESNPSLLYCEYKKKTLLSWCKFYHNTNAFMIVDRCHKKTEVKIPIAA